MAGPARAGLFIYAKDLASLAGFYEELLGLARLRSTDEPDAQVVASSRGDQVLLEQWRGPGFIARNAVDPEGNIFQLREGAP